MSELTPSDIARLHSIGLCDEDIATINPQHEDVHAVLWLVEQRWYTYAQIAAILSAVHTTSFSYAEVAHCMDTAIALSPATSATDLQQQLLDAVKGKQG